MNKKLFTLVYISLISLNIYAFDTSVVGSPNAPTTYTPTNGAYDPNNPWSSSGGINPVAPTTVQTPGNVVLTPTQPGTTPGSAITPTTQPGQAPVANKKWFDTLFGNKNCNYVDKKQYQPFSGIDETFPGAKTLGFEKSKVNKDVTCVNVSSATENIVKMVFTLAISIIIVLTIISISVSGIQYMTEEAIGKKGEAKKRLTNSFIALALGLLSYTILYTINKQLVEFSFNPSSIDTKNSVEKGIQSALTAATGTWTSGLSGIEAVNQTSNLYNPSYGNLSYNPTTNSWVNPYSTTGSAPGTAPGQNNTFLGTYNQTNPLQPSVQTDLYAKVISYQNQNLMRAMASGGVINLGGQTFPFNSGGGSEGYLPFGTYTVSNCRIRNDIDIMPTMFIDGFGYSCDLNDVAIDPRTGTSRTELRIHPDGGNPGTAGCIGIVGNLATQQQFWYLISTYLNSKGGRATITVSQ